MPLKEVLENYLEFAKECDFFRFWWIPHTESCIVWRANKTKKPVEAFNKAANPYYTLDLYHQLLRAAVKNPKLIRRINQVYGVMLYGKEPRHYIETIESCLNFDCLFP